MADHDLSRYRITASYVLNSMKILLRVRSHTNITGVYHCMRTVWTEDKLQGGLGEGYLEEWLEWGRVGGFLFVYTKWGMGIQRGRITFSPVGN